MTCTTRFFTIILCALIFAGCASKPATKAAEAKDAAATTSPAAEAAKAEAEAAPVPAPQEAEPRTAVVSDMTEPPPPPPTLVLAPDEPAPPEVARAPEALPKKVEAAPQPSVAAPKEAPPAAKEAAKPAAKPKEPVKPKAAPPVVKPAEEKAPPPPARETVPVPAAGLGELPTRAAPEAAEDTVSYSRTVRATVGQLVEVPFRGAGWVFLGELSSRKGLPYDSRRLDADGQSFIFRAEAVGSYSLKFFRQDFIEDYIVNDYVRVIIGESAGGSTLGGFSVPVDRGRVVAEPRWPVVGASAPAASPQAQTAASASAAPQTAPAMTAPTSPAASASAAPIQAAPASASAATMAVPAPAATTPATAATARAPASVAPQAASAPVSAPTTGAATSVAAATPNLAPTSAAAASPTAVATGPQGIAAIEALPSDAGPEAFLAIVKTEAEAGRTSSALEVLDRFRDRFPAGTDEAWWLYGRLLETNGPTKDVKAALGFYKRLVADYPQSSRYDEARKRIAYLERYYFQIR